MSQQASTLDTVNENSMTLMEHLQELRVRLMWISGGLIAGTLLSMLFVTPLLEFIIAPLTREGVMPQALGPTDTVGIFFRISFTAGASLAMPVIAYQVIAFVSPGLYPHERRALLWTLPGIMILFLTGAAFSFYVLMPAAVNFLQQFLGTVIRQDWTIDRYIGFVTRIVFWIGVAFETPLVVAFMARAGIVTGQRLLGFWRHAIVVVAIVAAAITPTVDPVNMAIVMGPLTILYFISVGLAYMLYRPRVARTFDDDINPPAPPAPKK
jgi:sec-independent protein translocase protein TatC